MGEPVYQLLGVTRVYGARKVLDIASLDVYPGEILGVVGPSGAGKSTLLRLLGFLETPTSGAMAFRGQRVNGGAPSLAVRRQVTMVFQRPVLLSDSVYANVAYGLRVRGVTDARERVEKVLDLLGMLPLRKEAASTLSGGEAQRVALARALVVEPEVLLLDEPTANLDPAHVAIIENVIRQARERTGMTIVLVTHNVFQARRLADRVALLVSGRLVEVAPTKTFFESPSAPETHAFISGEMVY
ncbi:MAG: phosphate ABC transporter ATP-binding protein [Anaerolineae bacterium]|nr:phosphate ABC transporter ATP-binding protein [Anaerolineae bacterium]